MSDVIAFAGAQGILKISFLSEESYIKRLLKFLEEDFKVEEIS